MRSQRLVGVLAIVALVSSACRSAGSFPAAEPGAARPVGGSVEWSGVTPEAALERERQVPYLVRRGWLDLTVEEPATVAARAQEITSGLSGMVQSATVSEDRAQLLLRVPEPRLDEALDRLSTLGDVDSRRLSANDVTEEVIDLEARVSSLIGVRDRLRALLDRSSALSDIMAVERELARVQAEIDAIDGRLRHLRSRAVMAELSLSARRERILGPIGWVLAGAGTLLQKLFVIR